MIIPPIEDNLGDRQKAAIRLSNEIRKHVNNTNLGPTVMKAHNRVNLICIINSVKLSDSPLSGVKERSDR